MVTSESLGYESPPGTTFSIGRSARGGKRSFAGRCGPHCDVSDPKARAETQPFVEGVHAGICSTALHQHVVAVGRPCMFQCGPYDGLAVTLPSQLRVSNDVLQEPVPPSAAKQIRCNDEHAGCSNPSAIVGCKYVDAWVRQSFLSDAVGAFLRLCDRTYLRHIEKREEGWQIRRTGEASDGHGLILADRCGPSLVGSQQ